MDPKFEREGAQTAQSPADDDGRAPSIVRTSSLERTSSLGSFGAAGRVGLKRAAFKASGLSRTLSLERFGSSASSPLASPVSDEAGKNCDDIAA